MNIIPDYDYLFNDDKNKPDKKKNGFLKKVLKTNFWKIVLSTVLYTIRAAPLWIISIVSANVINIVTGCIAAGTVTQADSIKLLINGIVLALSLIQNVPTTMANLSIANNILRDTSAGLKSTLVRKLQKLSVTYYKEMETGKIQSKFLRDLENTDVLLSNIILNIIPTVVSVIISVIISLYHSGIVTLFFLVVIPINVTLTKIFQKDIRKNNRLLRQETEKVSADFSKMLDMIPVTKSHGLENEEINSFNMSVRRLRAAGLISDRTNSKFGSVTWVISNLLSASCLFFCSFLAIKKIITVGDIVLYQSLFGSINSYILQLTNCIPVIASGMESVSSISEIMTSDEIENSNPNSLSDLEGNIKFENVYYKYPNSDDYVIKDFSLDVKKGECIALVGSSGSGKSTIMNMIIGFLTATEGSVLIDGKNINSINLTDYRQHISVVSQNNILFNGTIKENITYGLKEYSDDDLKKVLDAANVNEFLPELPDGVNTKVGEEGGKLSGGQKQRISIARALIRNPKILIMDEATSALDNISEYHVQNAISKLIEGRTTFIVAHRLSTIRNADRIIVMEQGRIAESGTYDALMNLKGKFYELKSLSDMTQKNLNQM